MKLSLLHSDFSETELSVLSLDGQSFPQYCFVDECDDWRSRSEYILREEKWPMILTGTSAVWAHGAGTEPSLHTASLIPPNRIRIPRNSKIVMEERSLESVDYWQGNTHGVTTPLRTIYDLLRTIDHWTDFKESATLMMTTFNHSALEVEQHIMSSGIVPYKKLALERIRNWC